MNRRNNPGAVIGAVVVIFIIYIIIAIINNVAIHVGGNTGSNNSSDKQLTILSSYENRYLETSVLSYAKSKGIDLTFKYMGDLDIVQELNKNSKNYDGVWISNSMWLYLLDNPYLTSEAQSISISPVAIGIKRSKAQELDLIGKDVTNNQIIDLIKNKKIKYVMPSVTQTNTGATAYFGFLNALAGNPETLTDDMLKSDKLVTDLTALFSGVERVSGDEDYLKDMFLNSTIYEAVIADESALININQKLVAQNKEPLYLIYPTDGVAINDSELAFISNYPNKKESFLTIQKYLLSGKGQELLASNGRRTWYGGSTTKANKTVFNPDWGIDTTKYLNVTKFPSKKVMNDALNFYVEKLRKPTYLVFCLDFSSSMNGEGVTELKNAMDYILTYDKASADRLQFSEKDKISVITFSSAVNDVWETNSGYKTDVLINNINNNQPYGSTALYDAIIRGLDILKGESDDYTKTIIAMTDGLSNVGSYSELSTYYNSVKSSVPIYSITFGDANETQLSQIASLSNAKVFDGRTNLLGAFKKVRGYN